MKSVVLGLSFLNLLFVECVQANPLEDTFDRLGIGATRAPIAGVDGYTINPFDGDQVNRNHYDSRGGTPVSQLVMHYTACSAEQTLRLFTEDKPDGRVSAHYVITESEGDMPGGVPIRVVPEDSRAWHAGISLWGTTRNLNASSIGIENVNQGFTGDEAQGLTWYPFDEAQIGTLGRLAQNIIQRHQIAPKNVVGHADITDRKQDPGILFPWERLFTEFEVGAWLTAEERDEAYISSHYSPCEMPPQGMSNEFLLARLEDYGYHLPSGRAAGLTPENKAIVKAFRAHFSKNQRLDRYNRDPDREDMVWIWGLSEKYKGS